MLGSKRRPNVVIDPAFSDIQAKFLSESMKELVDSEIKKLLDESYARAKSVLGERKLEHQRLTEALLK